MALRSRASIHSLDDSQPPRFMDTAAAPRKNRSSLEPFDNIMDVPKKWDPVVRAARVVARLARVVEQECLDEGMALSQYRLMLFAARAPLRAGALASHAALTRPAVTAAVNGLTERGLLERQPVVDDRRGICLAVTRAGRAALARVERRLADRLSALLGPVESVEAILLAMPAIERSLDRELEREIEGRDGPARRAVSRR